MGVKPIGILMKKIGLVKMIERNIKNRVNNIRYNADKYLNYEELIKDILLVDVSKKPNEGKIRDIQVLSSEYIDLDNLIIEILRACNYTYKEIGEIYETSRQAIHNRVKYNSMF